MHGALQYTCVAGEGVTAVMGFVWPKPRYHRESFNINSKMDGWVDLAREWFSEWIRSAKCSSREPHEEGLASCIMLLALGMSFIPREILDQQEPWDHKETKEYGETKERR